MHGLPADFDGAVFVGCELDAVCFYEYTMALIFREEISISITSSFIYSGESETKQKVPVLSSTLMRLVGKRVESAFTHPNGTLMLTFAGGETFTCFDDLEGFESYYIQIGDRQIVV
jgi:hypothetical protein